MKKKFIVILLLIVIFSLQNVTAVKAAVGCGGNPDSKAARTLENVHKGKSAEELQLELEAKRLLKALDTAISDKDVRKQAICNASLGDIYNQLNKKEKALQYYKAAFDNAKTLKKPPVQFLILEQICKVHKGLHQFHKQAEYADMGMDIASKEKDLDQEYLFALMAGNALHRAGKPEEGRKRYFRALEIAREKKDKAFILDSLGLVAGSYGETNQYEKALEYFETALKLAGELGEKRRVCLIDISIGLQYLSLNRYEKALPYFQDALKIAEELDDYRLAYLSHLNIGEVYSSMGDYEKAAESSRMALKLTRDKGDKSSEAFVLRHLAKSYQLRGNLPEALKYYEESYKLVGDSRDRREAAMSLDSIAGIYSEMGNYEKALELYKKSLDIAREIKNEVLEGDKLENISFLYQQKGENLLALKYLNEALELAKRRNDPVNEGRILMQISSLYVEMSRFYEGLKYGYKAVEMAEKSGDSYEAANRLGYLGISYARLGDFPKAFSYMKEALNYSRKIKDVRGEITWNAIIGLGYLQIQESEEAIPYFERAHKLAIKTGDSKSAARALLNLGMAETSLQKYDNALRHYEEGINIAQKGKLVRIENELLLNLISVYIRENRLGKAEEYLTPLHKRLEKSDDLQELALAFGYSGDVSFRKADYKKAASDYQRAVELTAKSSDSQAEFIYQGKVGMAYYYSGEKNRAVNSFKKAVEILEKTRDEIKIDELKSSFSSGHNRHFVYDMLISLLVEEGRIDEAFEYSERSKARSLLDSLGNKAVEPKTDEGKKLNREAAEVLSDVRSLEVSLRRARGEQADKIRAEIDQKQKKYRDLMDLLKLKEPEYSSLKAVSALKAADLQKVLKPDEALVEYYTSPDKLIIWVVTKDSVKVKVIKKGSGDLNRTVARVRRLLRPDTSNLIELNEVREKLNELYSILIKPVENEIAGGKTIIVVPHGSLHYLPFSALVDDKDDYLIQNRALIIEPSASSFVLFRKRNMVRPDSLLCFAIGGDEEKPELRKSRGTPQYFRGQWSPLPGTKKEVESIGILFQKRNLRGKEYIGEDFTLERIQKEAPDAGIVHFATHGFFSDRGRGNFSGLVTYDKYVYIADVFNWNLNARLVVLSACQTALGNVSEGEEMAALSRAFLQAGADNLVASLWSVDDEATRDLMIAFYDELLQNKTPQEALRQAKLKVMKKHPHPFYWAAFTVYGKGR